MENNTIITTYASTELLRDVMQGLQKTHKTLPSKYFYDQRGSELFEEICELEEYYPTRTELSIMKENINEITELLGSNVQLVELGSGSSLKTRLLLDHLTEIDSYVPVDISNDFLAESVEQLKLEYPLLDITPVAADYTQHYELPAMDGFSNRIIYYPGSTIGNFTNDEAAEFLKLTAKQVNAGGGLLIGFDLIKDQETLINAYNDEKGVTAAFNKNILRRINRELDANFNPDAFRHLALFNEKKSRIEMHLVSNLEQTVNIMGTNIHFSKGETIHTENSHKYSLRSFREMTDPYFKNVTTWIDSDNKFCVQFLTK